MTTKLEQTQFIEPRFNFHIMTTVVARTLLNFAILDPVPNFVTNDANIHVQRPPKTVKIVCDIITFTNYFT